MGCNLGRVKAVIGDGVNRLFYSRVMLSDLESHVEITRSCLENWYCDPGPTLDLSLDGGGIVEPVRMVSLLVHRRLIIYSGGRTICQGPL